MNKKLWSRKIKVFDGNRYFFKFLAVSFLLIVCILLFTCFDNPIFSLLEIACVIITIVYLLISISKTTKEITIREYLNTNATDDGKRQVLMDNGLSEKEISELLNCKQLYELEVVEDFMNKFNKMNIREKMNIIKDMHLGYSPEYYEMQLYQGNISQEKYFKIQDEYYNFGKKYDLYDDGLKTVHKEILKYTNDNEKIFYDTIGEMIEKDLGIKDINNSIYLLNSACLVFNNKDLYLICDDDLASDLKDFLSKTYYVEKLIEHFLNKKMKINWDKYKKIKYNDILYYDIEGNVEHYTSISGGGFSGDINALRAEMHQKGKLYPNGDAGALYSMLSDIKIDPIKTSVHEIDNRSVILKTKDMDYTIQRFNNDRDFHKWLLSYIPEKDFSRIKYKEMIDNKKPKKK